MPTGIAVALVVAACVAMVILPKILSHAVGTAVGHGVDKAIEARKRGRPSLFWLVPDKASTSSLCEAVRAHAGTLEESPVAVHVAERKGREVVECSIAPGADADSLRVSLLRVARERDPSCVLELP